MELSKRRTQPANSLTRAASYAAVRENSDRSSAEIRDEILRRVYVFLDKEQAQDDLTLIVAKIH